MCTCRNHDVVDAGTAQNPRHSSKTPPDAIVLPTASMSATAARRFAASAAGIASMNWDTQPITGAPTDTLGNAEDDVVGYV